MTSSADLTLYDRDGRLIAIAEIKNKQGTSREWAAKLRQNILAHGRHYNADFFLLVTPDRLYIWKSAGAAPTLIQPTYELDARPIFAPYFERAGVKPSDISGHAFELVVAAWLGDLVRSEEQQEALTNGQHLLAESGFLTAARDGRIAYEEAACKEILRLSEAGSIHLVIPAYSIAEPYETLVRRHNQRKRMKADLDDELRQLARTTTYTLRLIGFHDLTVLLIDSANEEAKRLEEIRTRLLKAAEIIPLETLTLTDATQHQRIHGLSPQDAIVYAAVLSHLQQHQTAQSCFLNRNSKDFDDPDLVEELNVHNCKLLARFDTGYQFILSHLSQGSESA